MHAGCSACRRGILVGNVKFNFRAAFVGVYVPKQQFGRFCVGKKSVVFL